MSVNVTGAYIYFTIPIFGGIPITQTTVSSFIVTLILIIAAIVLGRGLKKRPDGKQVLVEKGVMMMHNMVLDTMDPTMLTGHRLSSRFSFLPSVAV